MKRSEKPSSPRTVYVPVDEWKQLQDKLKLLGFKHGASEWTRQNMDAFLNDDGAPRESKIDLAALAQKLAQITLEKRKLETTLDHTGHSNLDALIDLAEEFGLLESFENLDAVIAELIDYKPIDIGQWHRDSFDRDDIFIFIRLLHLYKQINEIKGTLKKVGLIKGVAPAENIGGETSEATTVESPEKMDDDPEVLKEVFAKVSSPVIEEQENEEEEERKIPDEDEE